MKKFVGLFVLFALITAFSLSFTSKRTPAINPNSQLSETLFALESNKPNHFLETVDPAAAAIGKQLLIEGRALDPNGKMGNYISKYYNCLSCHNLEKEDPNPAVSDPESRLTYAIANNLPFLQGTTFKGIVSRESFYNDDYAKKYGDLVKPARHDLRESIQLCATQCAQGRLLESWELEAILAFFWTIDYQLKDLSISEGEYEQMNILTSRGKKQQALDMLRTKYIKASPAHFGDLPLSFKEGYKKEGNTERGKEIFERSCLHCHRPDGESKTVFADDFSFDFLQKSMYKSNFYSYYSLLRKGTYAMPGHRPYMPNYSLERMSDQQVEDLRAYIEFKANS